MTDEEFDELLIEVRRQILRQRLAPPSPQDRRDSDEYATKARHTEFGACAH
ncbi:hypothetical protein ACJWDR_19330 [Streptomyces tauricus]|uniref:hypothetical protein n=1 Tax=Streptomyces tauricus TaxID=68274 RepID=UPI00387EE8A1